MPAIIKIEINSASAGSGFADAQRGLKDLDKAARDSGGGFSALKEVAIGALREIGAMATQALGAAASAAAGFVKDSVSAAADFEAGINNLNSVAGASLEEMGFSLDDVSDKALDLGKATQFSAKESLDAMTELVKGGVPIESVMTDATDATLALAAAGGVELTKSAEIVSKSLGVWGANGLTATAASDAIAAAANASTLDVEGFAGAMYNAQGRAAAMEMGFEDFATTIAMISPGFKSGETAGVSYNNFLSSLIPKTKKADQAMYDLGLITEDGTNKFFDSTGAFIGNRDAAQLLQDAFKDLTPEQALMYKNTIFGNDAMGAANMLIEKGAAGYDESARAMAAAGTAADVARTKQEGFAFAMEQFKGSVETAQIVLGTKLLPMLTPLIGKFTDLINIGLEFASGNYFTALTSLGSWLSENVNPALGSFVANLALATDPLQTLKDGILTFLGDVATALPGQLMAWAAAFMTWAVNATPGMLANLAALAQSIYAYVVAQMPGITASLQAWVTAFGAWVLSVLPGLGANLAGLYQMLYTWIGLQLPGIVAQLAVWGQAFSDWIVAAAPVILTEIGAFYASMLNYLIANAPQILATLGEWTVQFVAWAVTTGAKLIYEMGVLFGKFLAWFIEVAPRIQSTMKEWEKATTQWILESWPGWMRELGALWGKFKAWIGETAGKLSSDGSIGKALVDGIKKGIDSALAGLIAKAASAVQSAISAAQNAGLIDSPSKAMANEVGLPLAQGIAQGMTNGMGLIASAGAALAQQAVSGAQNAMAAVGQGLMASAAGGGGDKVSPQMLQAATATWGRAMGGNTTNKSLTNNFTMNVKTNAKASTVASDFGMMKALAGVR